MDKPKIPQMCRLCLTRKPFFYNFVDTKNNWAALTKQLTGIDPFADTRYPQKLCLNCRKKLDAWSAFRKKCLKSQIQFGKEFLDNQPSLDMEVEMEMPSLAPLTDAATISKPEKYMTFEMAMPSLAPLTVEKIKIKEESKEFFRFVAIVDEEQVKNDPTKFEEVVVKSEQVEIDEILDVKTEQTNDKLSSTDSEPEQDFSDFEPEPKNSRQTSIAPSTEPAFCHICGKTFSRKSLPYHLNWHDDLRPYVCQFEGCTESFNSPARERKHRNRHFEKKCVCTVCDKKFFDNSYLKRHMLSHTKNWENVCPHCSKKCANKYNLKVHLRIHTGDRPFACQNCNATFAYNSLLKTHKEKCVGERSNDEREDESNENEEQ